MANEGRPLREALREAVEELLDGIDDIISDLAGEKSSFVNHRTDLAYARVVALIAQVPSDLEVNDAE
jgi:hypothetical protein